MRRRYFNHVYNEICVAVERRISRYDLWLMFCENGGDPNSLTKRQTRHFIDHNLTGLLSEIGVPLDQRAQRRLETRILRFDPRHPTPEEWLMSLIERAAEAT